jgi:hypothetical protein
MMKNMKRTLRRHHVIRLKNERRWYYGQDLWKKTSWIGKAVTTPHPCSNICCGNQRPYYRLTLQELRGLDAMRDMS